MTTPQYRVQIRDHNLNPVGELTDFIDGDLLLAFNDVGQFVFTVRASGNAMAPYLAAGNGIIVSRDRGDGTGAQTLFSGPFWHLERHGKDDTYVLSGPSDEWWLKAARCYPQGGRPYSGVVLLTAPAPLRYYRLDDASGSTVATDSSGNGQNGTYVGSPTLGASGLIPGDADTAATFNGSSQYATIPMTGLPTGASAWSIEAWVKPTNATNTNDGSICAFGDGGSNGRLVGISQTHTGGWSVFAWGGTVVGGGTSAAGVTHHVVGTFDGTSLRLYVDDALVAGPTAPGVTVNVSGTHADIGALYNGTAFANYFAGTVDECALYNVALSATQVSAHYTAGSTTHGAYDTRTGTASTEMIAYVNANLISPVNTDRALSTLSAATDPVIGSTVTGNARYDVLLALLQQLAISGGDLGFKVIQSNVGALTFSVYQPVTQSNAIFSVALGNLLDFVYTLDGPTANVDLAGGLGAGTGRAFIEGSDATSVATWGRIEGFLDVRDTADTATINQRITADLAQNKQQTNLSITPQDTPALMYGRDYNLGDVVNVTIDAATITDKIRQVHIVLNGTDQELVTPGIGNAGAGQIAWLFDAKARALKAVQDKLNKLQAAL